MLRMDEILPQHILKLLPPPSTRSLQVHDCGTVVEACAKFVYDSGDSQALSQLAEYLYAADARDAAPHLGDRPFDADGASRVLEASPKGKLLEVEPNAVWIYSRTVDTPPIWTASVTVRGEVYQGKARHKNITRLTYFTSEVLSSPTVAGCMRRCWENSKWDAGNPRLPRGKDSVGGIWWGSARA